jgi:hypothetical protein
LRCEAAWVRRFAVFHPLIGEKFLSKALITTFHHSSPLSTYDNHLTRPVNTSSEAGEMAGTGVFRPVFDELSVPKFAQENFFVRCRAANKMVLGPRATRVIRLSSTGTIRDRNLWWCGRPGNDL